MASYILSDYGWKTLKTTYQYAIYPRKMIVDKTDDARESSREVNEGTKPVQTKKVTQIKKLTILLCHEI